MALKVLHVHVTPAAVGGSERTMRLAVGGLRTLGIESHLLYGDAPPSEPSEFDGLMSDPVAFLPRQSPVAIVRCYRRIASYVRDHDIDIIHTRLWPPTCVRYAAHNIAPSVATAHLPVCPNGARFHYATERPCDAPIGRVCVTRGRNEYQCGLTANLEPFGPLGLERGVIRAKAELRLLRASAFVMAPSEWQRQRLSRDGLPARQILVVPSPIKAAIVRQPVLPRPRPPIVFFGARLTRFKGAHHLLEAVARIDEKLQVEIAGDGPEANPLRVRATRLGIEHRVTFLGALGPAEMQARCARATVVAVPSLWPETFNRTGPEALAVGTPVVAYVSGGVGEWLRPGVTGLAVPTGDIGAFADALREVVHGDALSRMAREHGPAVAAEFGVQRHVASVVACYEAALRRPGTGAR